MSKKILIDANNLAFKSYFTHKDLCSQNGMGSGMPYGFIQIISYLFFKYQWKSEDVFLIWDGYPKHKHQLYPEYKAGRKKDENIPKEKSPSTQLKLTRLLMGLFGMQQIYNREQESDDMIASLTDKYKDVTIVSSDHDFYQLLNHLVEIMIYNGSRPEEIITQKSFVDMFEIDPSKYICVQTLAGCDTDNVPGMQGVAEPTAIKLLKLNSWSDIYKNSLDIIFPDKRSETVFRKNFSTWNIQRDYQLVKLNKNLPIDILKSETDIVKLRNWFVKLGFKHYLLPDNFTKLIKLFGG